MPLVEKRYAQALLELSGSDINSIKEEFGDFTNLYNSDKDFRDFLNNPVVKTDKKQALIRSVFTDRLSKNMLNMILLLVSKHRTAEIPGIFNQFIQMANETANVLDMKIIMAAPMDEVQLETLREKFKKKYNAVAVNSTEIVDESLIGGLKVIIGDKVYDGSVKGRIESLTEIVSV
ncbi:ATP synthase F1 subunit delta [Ruminiclostridium cellulolyticum]|uniref:ATP synthase subunit delta n=1 Tax=Ruminiclostridium cellulolyticum (strain ATCC 35319 / DSM 5812 / JCM 6584 / H10) TaxID=394503 RepID=ATPD_RUMCH|nr:ATP synthase F1 subunit delta [Ruminiclostridium cellulolyticum]B8I576.1 RecName: Full=ATP synthase subunit delta; AltName: Full=ATP synthase F(1) sector subunit delta; AltName: Full=F-type ATPase subunit delta; Short=F-ATPase subunit delta [Ruminiclostridium cellulolyticum H10]ACL74656.1 ATP synthase F1, delta subunit [Ruminiclostridium cellulolyticum H10]